MVSKDEDELVKKIFTAHSAMVKMAVRTLDVDGRRGKRCVENLTRVQFELLHLIKTMENATVSALVNATGTSKSSISITLTKLEKGGYINRLSAGADDDKRRVYMKLTPKGNEALEEAERVFICKIEEYYNGLSEKQKKLFESIIENIYELFVDNKEDIKNEVQ